MTDVSFCVNSWAVAETSTRIPSAPSKLKVDLTVHIEGWLVTQCLLQTSVSSYKIEMLWIDQQFGRLPGKFGSKVGIKQLYLSQNLLVCWAVTSQLKQIPLLQHHSLLCLDLHIVEPRSVSWICIFEPEPLVVIKEQAMLCRQNTWNVLIIFFITSNINAYHSQKRHCPPPWSVRMSACQRRQGCSTSPFGRRTFATRPPSKAEDMGLSQGSFVSFLKERVKEVFTSIHVSVESTKPAEVYTTRRWHSWELRRELAGTSNVFWNGYEIYVAPHI